MNAKRLLLGSGLVQLLNREAGAGDIALNNFVTEHIDVSVARPAAGHDPAEPVRSFAFQTSREGRVFFFAKAQGPGVRVVLDSIRFRVFKAKGAEAMITLSDWARDWERPDTAMFEEDVGHEIMWGHIKIQPYYDGDPTGL